MNEKKGRLPKIRFPGFSGAWEQRKLGELTNIKTGSSDLQDAVDDGKYPLFVRSENIERSDRYIFDGEAILIPGEGRIGDIYHYINGKFDYHQRVYKISNFADSNTDGKFVLYYLQHNFKRHALAFTVKATVDSLRLPMLVDFEIKLPSLEEQSKIGHFFHQLDNLITLHQRKLDNVRELKSGLLQKMFPKNDEKFPELRFPGFTDAWEQRKLEELANFTKGSGYTKSDLREIGSPIILYGRLYTDYTTLIDDVNTFVDKKENSIISLGGEVIVPSSGETAEDIVRASVVGRPGIILGGDLNVIIPDKQIDPIFLALSISFGTPHRDMAKRAQGKSIVHLQNSDLKKIRLVFPSIEEQKEIVKFNLLLDNLITLHQRKLEHWQEMKKALLQQMFV